MQRSEMGLM
jgi:hypothetical protein